MASATLRKRLLEMTAELARLTPKPEPQIITDLRREPTLAMEALGMRPDPWQRRVLTSTSPKMMLCATRQGGKSRCVSAVVVRDVLCRPNITVLIVSPSERQSKEMLRKCGEIYKALGKPLKVIADSTTHLELENNSRILAVPASGDSIRCFSIDLLIADEASRIPDSLYDSVSPMLATSKGRQLWLSTPCGKRGMFYREWHAENHGWEKLAITADMCPRITQAFLQSERERMTTEIYEAEYYCKFNEASGAVFSSADIAAAVSSEVEPWDWSN